MVELRLCNPTTGVRFPRGAPETHRSLIGRSPMAGWRPLTPTIEVRVLAPEQQRLRTSGMSGDCSRLLICGSSVRFRGGAPSQRDTFCPCRTAASSPVFHIGDGSSILPKDANSDSASIDGSDPWLRTMAGRFNSFWRYQWLGNPTGRGAALRMQRLRVRISPQPPHHREQQLGGVAQGQRHLV